MTTPDPTRVLHLVLPDHFADWEPAFLTCELARQGGWQLVTLGLHHRAIRSLGGLTVTTDLALDDVDPATVRTVAVIGSPLWQGGEVTRASTWLRVAWQAGATVAAICGATLAAGHAGLLAGRRYTSNDPDFVATHVGRTRVGTYVDAPAVRDDRLITAGGLGYVEWAAELLVAMGALSPDERPAWVAALRGRPVALPVPAAAPELPVARS